MGFCRQLITSSIAYSLVMAQNPSHEDPDPTS
jgi:hypothetical protein